MHLTHQPRRSEWDEAYVNARVTTTEARFALLVVGIFGVMLMIF